jgi:hypothetical protein
MLLVPPLLLASGSGARAPARHIVLDYEYE